MRVDPNSSSAFLTPGIRDVHSSALLRPIDSKDTPNKEDYTVEELADKINKNLAEAGTHIKVKLHEKTNTIMVTVVSDETNEVVMEIPREKTLDLMYSMCVRAGIFMDEKM
ncbi:flagellar protein FlaG [Paenibacillus sp. FSL K6-2441]|uniref:flagellar protein FlaG n=1 Tax=Paenibacillus TaxID=44249 RepID=UPI0030DB4B62